MNVLSLFDGMSCGQIALNRAGIKYDNYYASEINKHSIAVTKANYPKTLHYGDIKSVWVNPSCHIDLLIGGSPCQTLSTSGDGSGFEGKSGLFFEFVRIFEQVQNANPDFKFLFENVKMKKENQDIISACLGVEPIEVNSNLVSGQNRKRLYWTNIDFEPLQKKEVPMFKDIIEPKKWREIPPCFYQKYGRKNRIDNGLNWILNEKSNTLTTKNIHPNQYILNEDKTLCSNLSVVDYERLQTIPEGYCDILFCRNTHAYEMIGNAWTVDVVAHIFSFLK